MNKILNIAWALALSGFAFGAHAADTPAQCTDHGCFVQAVQNCQPAQYSERHPLGQVKYAVMEAVNGDHCRVAMTYTDNPNPAWENQPLTFVLDSSQAIEPQLKQAVKDCMTGADGDWQCAGPLLTVLNGGAVDASQSPAAKAQEQTTGETRRGTATVMFRGKEQRFAWGDGVLVANPGDAYVAVVAADHMSYTIESKDGQLVVTDTKTQPQGKPASYTVETTGEAATVAGITGQVYAISDPSSGMNTAVTLTDDPRVAAVTETFFNTLPFGPGILASIPKPGILRLLNEDGKAIMELVSVSDQVPRYFDAVLQAAQTYSPTE